MFIGVEIMMFIGFGYLMTFLKWYGLGAVAFTMLITAIGIQWDLFTESFFDQAMNSHYEWEPVQFGMYHLLDALYAISAVLISFGALIGKINPLQLLVMTIIELALHSINYKVLMIGVLNVCDVGGTYSDHMFGAYFGLAVAYQLGRPKSDPEMGNVPDIFSFVGTLFLWIYWPSFVIGAAQADSEGQETGMVNTILALSSSTVISFWASSFLNSRWKFRPVDIQNATLAGGVAIGCTANLTMSAFGAIMIGIAAGLVSCVGYNIIQPYLETYELHDSCGVHNLHAMPSVVGAIASVIIAGYKNDHDNHDKAIYGYTFADQWWHQLLGIVLCVLFAVVTGTMTGILLRKLGHYGPEEKDRIKEFHDECWWHVAEDYGQSIYGELGKFAHSVDKGMGRFSDVDQILRDLQAHGGRRQEESRTDSTFSPEQRRASLTGKVNEAVRRASVTGGGPQAQPNFDSSRI